MADRKKELRCFYDIDRSVVAKHLKNIFEQGRWRKNSVCAKFAQTADNGKTYQYKFYSLAAIIAVGYRTNSDRAAEFGVRYVHKTGICVWIKRLINGQIFDEDYFEQLIAKFRRFGPVKEDFIRRLQIYMQRHPDYDKNSLMTKQFYA